MNLRKNLEMMRRYGNSEQADQAEARWKAQGLLPDAGPVGDAQFLDASEGEEAGALSAPGAFMSLFSLKREPGDGPVKDLPFPVDPPEAAAAHVMRKLGIERGGPPSVDVTRSTMLRTLNKLGIDSRPYFLNIANMHYANREMPETNAEIDFDPNEQAAKALADSFDLEGLLTPGGLEVALGSPAPTPLNPDKGIVTLAETNSHGDRDQKAYGFWHNSADPRAEALPNPRTFVDFSWDESEAAKVADALDSGKVVRFYRGYSICRICGGEPNGSRDLTDGTYVYPQGLGHYVRKHLVRVPRDMQARALGVSTDDVKWPAWMDRPPMVGADLGRGGGGGGGWGRGGGGAMRGGFPGGAAWARGRVSPLTWGDESGWWGGPWDGFCQDCSSPYCLCGAEDDKTCASCGSAWQGGDRGALAGAAAAVYARLLHARTDRATYSIEGDDDAYVLQALFSAVVEPDRRELLIAGASILRSPRHMARSHAAAYQSVLRGVAGAADLAPLGDIFGADAYQVRRISEIHARMKLHKTTALDDAQTKVGDDPDFKAYMARWTAFVTQMNDLGDRAKATLSWITDTEIETAELSLASYLTEWDTVRLKIAGKRQEKLLSILEESKARVEAKRGAPLPTPTADQIATSNADPDYKKAKVWASGNDLQRSQTTPYSAQNKARQKDRDKQKDDDSKLLETAKYAVAGLLGVMGLYLIATTVSAVGTAVKATPAVGNAGPNEEALQLEVFFAALAREPQETLGDALRRRAEALGASASPSAGGILAAAVKAGTQGPIAWTEVAGPEGMTLTVGKDLLRAEVDGTLLRLPTSWEESPGIARGLSGQLGEDIIVPSKRLADAIYAAAPVKTLYKSMATKTANGATMGLSTVEDVKRYNAFVDAQVAGSTDLQSGAEKLWILDARLDPKVNAEFLSRTNLPDPGEPRAMNYGAWDKSGRVQQSVGGAHNKKHFDVSQLFRPLKRWARGADGRKVDLLEWIERVEKVSPKYTALFKGDAGAYS